MPLIYFKKKTIVEAILTAYGQDPYWDNVVLLMRMDGTNNSTAFIDEKAHTLTVSEGHLSTVKQKFGPSSAEFSNGSGVQVNPASGLTGFNYGTGDFTIEFWFNLKSDTNGYQVMYRQNGAGPLIIFGDTGFGKKLMVALDANAAATIWSCSLTQTACINVWSHVAFTRQNGVCRMFVNGVLQNISNGVNPGTYPYTSFTDTRNITGTTTVITGLTTSGYIDDLRVTRGIARYTSSFDAPSTPSGVGVDLSYDWFWDKTVLAIKGGNAGLIDTSWFDSSTNAYPITKYTASISQSSSLSPFPGASPSFVMDSTTGATLPNGAGIIGAGQFCLEFWVNPNRFTSSGSYGGEGASLINNWYWYMGNVSGWRLYIVNTGQIRLMASTGVNNAQPTIFTSTGVLTAGTWQHVAITRDENDVLRCFINGVQDTSITYASSFNLNNAAPGPWPLRLGYVIADSIYYHGLDGKMSNIRIVTGQPVYTANFTVPTAPLSAISGTSVLIANSISPIRDNSTFIDSSANTLTITRTGDVAQGSISPFTAGGSAYFDISGDYLQLPVSTALSLTTNDFTIETWVNRKNKDVTYGKYPRIINASDTWSTANSWCLTAGHYDWGWDKFGFHVYAQNGNTSQMLQSTTTIVNDTWYHVAVTRQGNTFRMFVNGVLEATSTWAGALNTGTTNSARIGGLALAGSNNDFFNGYLSNLRIVNGSAAYTSNFTVPTAPLSSIPGTALLLKFDTCSVIDETKLNDIEMVGNVTLSPSTKKFGAASIKVESGGCLKLPHIPNYSFGTDNFTIEMWVNPTSIGTGGICILAKRPSASVYAPIFIGYWGNTTILSFSMSSNGSAWDIAAGAPFGQTLQLNTWSHLALVRSGNTFTPYVNGYAGSPVTSAASLVANTHPIVIGSDLDGTSFTGYIDDVRITKGTARYLSNFSPKNTEMSTRAPVDAELLPTTYDPYWQQVAMLMTMESLTENKGHTVTASGNGIISSTSFKFGSSSFQSPYPTPGYLTVAASNDFILTGAFTVEYWVKYTNDATYNTALSVGTYTNGILIRNNNGDCIYVNGTQIPQTRPVPQDSQWHHFAMTRDSANSVRVFVDGILKTTTTIAGAVNSAGGSITVGVSSHATAEGMYGYIDDLRVTKGIARYTSAFDVPVFTHPINGASF